MKTMSDYSCYCTPEQTVKALGLGAPIFPIKARRTKETVISKCVIEYDENTFTYVNPPTAEQMIGWLRSKNIEFHFDDETDYWNIGDAHDDITPLRWYGYSDNKELDAIDAALEYLNNKK